MVQTDAVLRGSRAPSHFICQDYIGIINTDKLSMVAISDGCSSSKHTDIGSRFILRYLDYAVRKYWTKLPEEHLILYSVNRSVSSCKEVGIDVEALDATVGLAYHYDNRLHASLYGDGFIIVINTSFTTIIEVEFPNGYPYYPVLELNSRNLERWKSIEDKGAIVRETTINNNGEILSKNERSEQRNELRYTVDPSAKCVIVSSDGLRSFVRSNEAGAQVSVPVEEVVSHIIKIPRWNGNFMQRRIQKFTDFCDKQGWKNLDDISLGAVYAAPD